MPINRDALAGLGEEILNTMQEAADDTWAEWLRAPFEEAAGWGNIPLTTALKEAGAKGNGIGQAIEYGHRRLVRDLLEMGESPTAKDANGDAPIHVAATLGHGLIIRTLLIEGAEVDEPDRKGRTPLHLSSISGTDVGVRALLAAGACPRHRHGRTGFCALDLAARNGHVDVMKTLLGRGADVSARASGGRSVLHIAAQKNRVSVIEFLATEAGVEVDCKDDNGMTPLHVAATNGHLPAVNALIAAGADVSVRTSTDYYIDYGPSRGDCSALDLAAHAGHVGVMRALVRHGADVQAHCSNYELTALGHAAAGNQLEAMRFLLDEGADANAKTGGSSWKPIHFVVQHRSAEGIQVLAQHGADLSARDEEDYYLSPLATVARKLDLELAKVLLAAGAEPNAPDDLSPALQMAVSSKARSEEMVKLLLERGADVNAVDFEGKNALHEATRKSTVGIVNLLVEAGAAVDGRCEEGYASPLHVACGFDRLGFKVSRCEVIKALLGHGACLDSCDESGNTPLHYASEKRFVTAVDLLLRAGADESSVNNDGETPADQVKRKHSRRSRYAELWGPVLRLLDGAPADRKWRRRGLLVLCRAFPDRARPATDRTRAQPPRAAKRRAPFGSCGGGGGASGELAAATSENAFSRVMARLIRLEEEGIFRKVVSFL